MSTQKWLALSLGLALACGARAELSEPEGNAEGAGAGGSGTGAAAGERRCLPNCYIGHNCCIGSCSGPAAVTESACCECLPGEVDSRSCDDLRCGN